MLTVLTKAGWAGDAQAIGPSRGGQTTKIRALTDVLNRPGVLLLTPGDASDVTIAPAVLTGAPGRIRRLAADKGYDADGLRTDLRAQGITPVIPSKSACKRRIRHDKRRYGER
jgi:IS5 family transposase